MSGLRCCSALRGTSLRFLLSCGRRRSMPRLSKHRLNESHRHREARFQVIRARRIEDAEMAVQTDAAIAAWSSTGARKGSRARRRN